MNIPARYCTGYLGDIGVPVVDSPMDFSGWFEAFLDGRWYTFDARHNVPRIGRVLMARGRDAADVAIATSFGVNRLAELQGLDRRNRLNRMTRRRGNSHERAVFQAIPVPRISRRHRAGMTFVPWRARCYRSGARR